MSECQRFEQRISELIAGELPEAESAQLHLHAAECTACCELLDLHQQLEAGGLQIAEPSEFELAALRRRLRREIEARGARGRHARRRWIPRVATHPALAAAAAVALLAAGFLAGRSGGPAGGLARGLDDAVWLTQLDASASHNAGLDDVEASPYLFTNVRLEPRGGGLVGLGFDVTTHLRLERSAGDPLVREILAQSLVNPAPLGTRLQAVKLSAQTLGADTPGAKALDAKTREALVFAMLNDSNQAVRLRALETLAAIPDDPRLRDAFLEVLTSDESVPLRLRAIDALEGRGVDLELLRDAIEHSENPGHGAVLVRASELVDS